MALGHTLIALCYVLCILSGACRAQQMPTVRDLLEKIFDTSNTNLPVVNDPINAPILQPNTGTEMVPLTESDLSTGSIPSTVSEWPTGNDSPNVSKGGKACGLNKECVRRFLCGADGLVNVNGTGLIDIRLRFGEEGAKDETACKYLEVCCNLQDKLTTPKVRSTLNELDEGCGYRNSDGVGFKIIGDEDNEAEFGEFPWMVAILRDELVVSELISVYRCGGAVIAPNVVLTAAHCVHNQKAETLVARAGEWDTKTTQEVLPHQDVRVKEIVTHEQYSKGALHNDIALLILQAPFSWAGNVAPICLPPLNANFDFSRCYATGWGKDKPDKEGAYQKILKKVELPVMPHDTCQANLRKTRLGNHYELDDSFLCAGGEKGKDTCKGDGGSPLVCPDPSNPRRYYQAGIVAWGVGCGVANVPGVYANVAYLRNWINEKLSARGIDFSHFTVKTT